MGKPPQPTQGRVLLCHLHAHAFSAVARPTVGSSTIDARGTGIAAASLLEPRSRDDSLLEDAGDGKSRASANEGGRPRPRGSLASSLAGLDTACPRSKLGRRGTGGSSGKGSSGSDAGSGATAAAGASAAAARRASRLSPQACAGGLARPS